MILSLILLLAVMEKALCMIGPKSRPLEVGFFSVNNYFLNFFVHKSVSATGGIVKCSTDRVICRHHFHIILLPRLPKKHAEITLYEGLLVDESLPFPSYLKANSLVTTLLRPG